MTLTIDLSPENEAALRAQAEAAGLSAEDFARRALDEALKSGSDSIGAVENDRSISEVIGEIWADMPHDVKAKLPRDGASEHDHYIYGWPKREP